MEYPDELERRLTELEIKAGFTEDLLETLNAMVARQQETIEMPVREIARLRQAPTETGGSPGQPDEPPPHY